MANILKNIIRFLPAFLLVGCLDTEIYQKQYEKFDDISCINVIALADEDLDLAKQFFKIDEKCNFELVITPHLIHNCSNPLVKSLGSDFDGYVKIELFKKNKKLFRSQTDFKGDSYKSHLKRLLNNFQNLNEIKNNSKILIQN